MEDVVEITYWPFPRNMFLSAANFFKDFAQELLEDRGSLPEVPASFKTSWADVQDILEFL